MAYYGTNGYGDDGMDVESAGPKVTVREVSLPPLRPQMCC